ncbi:hypothetical protein [Acidaminobacter sp.]|uniref:hypothetical protein n=1 Tax=Acidaminobacter sp. TaxID=1872102 RepID=UPI0025669464|nr:hypothetical protein [Acidaminobacter sp.]MDK9711921.1 hypothetical protein [Acidaminobacter sp.]
MRNKGHYETLTTIGSASVLLVIKDEDVLLVIKDDDVPMVVLSPNGSCYDNEVKAVVF